MEGAEGSDEIEKMLYSFSKKTGSHKDLHKIKNIYANDRIKYKLPISDSYSNEYNSYLSSYGEWDIEHTSGPKETNKIDHIVNINLKYINQINEAIEHELKFDNTSNLSRYTTKEPLPEVSGSIREGKKSKATAVYGLKWTRDIVTTDSMIKRKHTKPYEHNLHYNKVEYSTTEGPYFTTHDIEVPFWMPELSNSNIIPHLFHVDNDKG